MNWYSGNIAEAVQLSKARNATFVVFVEGTNELSTKMSTNLDDQRIRTQLESSNFVAIKIRSDSEAYMQFAQIYKLVPLPSLFFIGKDGVPLEIVTGVSQTVAEIEEKIIAVISKTSIATQDPTSQSAAAAAPSTSNSTSSSTPPDSEVVCEGGVCYKKPVEKKETSQGASTTDAPVESAIAIEERLKRAKDLIEQKKKEKEAEDARLAKERELERRRAGQDIQSFKKRQDLLDMQQMKEERKKDKAEEQAIRKRILDQIAQDRAERAQKFATEFGATPSAEQTKETVQPKLTSQSMPRTESSEFTRIQFKKPDGETEMHTFNSTDKFEVLRSYVTESVLLGTGIRNFTLASSFPRKEFTEVDDGKTMIELDLAPTAVILILSSERVKTSSSTSPKQKVTGTFDVVAKTFWSILNPVFALLTYIKEFVFRGNRGAQKRASEENVSDNDAAKRRNLHLLNEQQAGPSGVNRSAGAPYKRTTNIHRLQDHNDESDEDNNTWNGNSTQQQ